MVWFTLILVSIFLLYGISSYIAFHEPVQKIEIVEAGPTAVQPHMCTDINHRIKSNDILRSNDGESIPAGKMKPLCVQGNCMREKGIEDGDIVFAEMFPKKMSDTEKKKYISAGQILLIRIEPQTGSPVKTKIRLAEEIGQDKVITYYFANDQKTESTQPHLISNTIGGG